MTRERKAAPAGGLALLALPVACCVGVPLLAAAGLSVGALAWVGGALVGGLALAGAAALVALRARRRRAACEVPAGRAEEAAGGEGVRAPVERRAVEAGLEPEARPALRAGRAVR